MTQERTGVTPGVAADKRSGEPGDRGGDAGSGGGAGTAAAAGVTADQVTDFLRRHPDFLACRPELLKLMTPPERWTGEVVVDMQRFMVDTLKQELEGLRNTTHEVIETSRSNMAYQTRTHDAVLALLAAEDLHDLVEIVTDELPAVLDVDVAVVGLEAPTVLAAAVSDVATLGDGEVDRLVGTGREVRLVRELVDDGAVFAGGAGLVRSAAFARLRPGPQAAAGLLALGIRREGAFHAGQGTELLRFLARILEVCLRRLLAA